MVLLLEPWYLAFSLLFSLISCLFDSSLILRFQVVLCRCQVEREEAENGGEIKPPPNTQKMQVGGGESAFPSLGDAVKVKETKKEKKKKMHLTDFWALGTNLDNIVLPKAPRSKDELGEEPAGFRGGFKEGYGRSRPGMFPPCPDTCATLWPHHRVPPCVLSEVSKLLHGCVQQLRPGVRASPETGLLST